MMFRVLPPFGQDQRGVAEVVNGIMNGKTNNTGTITLNTGNATTTSLVDERISVDTKIILIPFSDAAEADAAPYGAFQDSTDQVATTLSDANMLSCDTTDLSNGVYLSNTNRFNVRNGGIYSITYSIQVKNTTNDSQNIDIWLRKNGSDLAGTNRRFGLSARKSTGDPSYMTCVNPFFLDLASNDYVQISWHPSDLGVSIEQYPVVTASPGVTPAHPASPSAIVVVQYVAPMAYSNVYISSQTAGSAVVSHYANSTANKTYAYILIG